MEKEGFEKCLHLDSDVMLYTDVPDEWEKFKKYDMTLALDNGNAVGHNSFINNIKVLEDLCAFITACYTDPVSHKHLKSIYNLRMEESNCGIDDMVFLREFAMKYPDGIWALQLIIEDSNYDENINHGNGFERDNGLKKIYWTDDKPYCKRIKDGKGKGKAP